MSALDVLRSFAESRESDESRIPGLTYGQARELLSRVRELEEERDDLQTQCSLAFDEALAQENRIAGLQKALDLKG